MTETPIPVTETWAYCLSVFGYALLMARIVDIRNRRASDFADLERLRSDAQRGWLSLQAGRSGKAGR